MLAPTLLRAQTSQGISRCLLARRVVTAARSQPTAAARDPQKIEIQGPACPDRRRFPLLCRAARLWSSSRRSSCRNSTTRGADDPRNTEVILPKKIPNDDDDSDRRDLEIAADEEPDENRELPSCRSKRKSWSGWDEPPEATGHEATTVHRKDETSIAEELINEGTDEADRERRIAAEDPDLSHSCRSVRSARRCFNASSRWLSCQGGKIGSFPSNGNVEGGP